MSPPGRAEGRPATDRPLENSAAPQAHRSDFESSAWVALAARLPLPVATRTVVGQLADRADRRGRVRATAGELSACTALPVTAVSDALADLCSRGLVGRDGRTLVLTSPGMTTRGANR